MSPRRCVYVGFYPLDNREDERFFAALRMTGWPISIREMRRSGLRPDCHAEDIAGQTKGRRREAKRWHFDKLNDHASVYDRRLRSE